MRFNNVVFGVVLVLFALTVWAYSETFPEMPGQAYGPALFPRIIAAGLGICGVSLIVDGMRTLEGQGWVNLPAWTSDPRRVINVLLIPAGLLFYIGLSEPVGFLPVALALLLVLLWRNGARLWVALLLATATTVSVHTLFYHFLHVPLPWGVLEHYAW